MKTKCCLCIAYLCVSLFLQRANAQANTKLSNLVPPTAVNINLLPGGTTGTKNLGSDTKRWQDGHFDGTIYCHGHSNNTYGVYSTGVTSGVFGSGNSCSKVLRHTTVSTLGTVWFACSASLRAFFYSKVPGGRAFPWASSRFISQSESSLAKSCRKAGCGGTNGGMMPCSFFHW